MRIQFTVDGRYITWYHCKLEHIATCVYGNAVDGTIYAFEDQQWRYDLHDLITQLYLAIYSNSYHTDTLQCELTLIYTHLHLGVWIDTYKINGCHCAQHVIPYSMTCFIVRINTMLPIIAILFGI